MDAEERTKAAEARAKAAQQEAQAAEARALSANAQLRVAEERLKAVQQAIKDPERELGYKVLTARKDKATIFAAGVACVSVFVAFAAYFEAERAKSLERTYKLLDTVTQQFSDEERAKMYKYFPGRFDYSYSDKRDLKPMSEEHAERLLNVSRPVSSEDAAAKKCVKERKPPAAAGPTPLPANVEIDLEAYNVARKHLNTMEGFAFSYLHNTAHRETLARAVCPALSKSNAYFEPLIRRFYCEVGLSQSWQVIPQAVAEMENDYGGKECAALYSDKPGARR